MKVPSTNYQSEFQVRFGGAWAKLEVLLGLLAAGVGLLLCHWGSGNSPTHLDPALALPGLVLLILGGYLALAGQRSHIYRSVMESENSLREFLLRLHAKG